MAVLVAGQGVKMKEYFVIKPLEHILDLSRPPINMPFGFADYPSKNVRVNQNRIIKRWGYDLDRTVKSGATIGAIARYKQRDETLNIMILTDEDLMLRETGTDKTFSYKTEAIVETDTIKDITGKIITGVGTNWDTDDIVKGDLFIQTTNDYTADEQLDDDWGVVDTIDTATQITLDANYTGTTGDWTAAPRDGLFRLKYAMTTGNRWQHAVVNDKFCFTNGSGYVQYWAGSNYASALDSTNAVEAKYCIEYANRLLIADCKISGTREPWTVKWSKNNDPTTWTGSTTGSVDFVDTEDVIVGLGKVGASLVVYKGESIHVGYRTGDADSPISFPTHQMGIGCAAPYSITHFLGTNAFIGKDDFYIMDGDRPFSIGDRIRNKFFSIVDSAQLKNCFGTHIPKYGEILWIVNTSDGRLGFAWDYKDKEWTIYDFNDSVSAVSGW